MVAGTGRCFAENLPGDVEELKSSCSCIADGQESRITYTMHTILSLSTPEPFNYIRLALLSRQQLLRAPHHLTARSAWPDTSASPLAHIKTSIPRPATAASRPSALRSLSCSSVPPFCLASRAMGCSTDMAEMADLAQDLAHDIADVSR